MTNMMLYMTPGSCSTAIHIILEELEEVFEATIVNLPAGENRRPDYLAINPRGTIPSLRLSPSSIRCCSTFASGRTRPASRFQCRLQPITG